MAGASKRANPSGNHVPTPNNLELDDHALVINGNTDVAETLDGERMKVQAPGRLPMQRVYLLKGSADAKKNEKGLTNRPYDMEEDGTFLYSVGRLPSAQELLPGSDVVQYLEVGIVIGDDPPRFKPAPLTNKKNKDDRKQRGDMPRHPSAIRAFIHIAPTVAFQAKFVVGVRPIDGYFQPRIIDSECIFFYPEFWKGLEKTPKKARKLVMHIRVKRLATESETRAECTTATIAAEELASPDVVDSPHIATPGVKGFFNFDEELTMEDTATVAHELKIDAPVILGVVQATHRIVREHNLGDRLPYDDIAFFLEFCNYNIPSVEVGEEVMVQEVKRALDAVEIHDKYKTR